MSQGKVVFLVADRAMETVFSKFLNRERFWQGLRCGSFDWDLVRDVQETDGGVHRRGHLILEPFRNTHEYAVVVLDSQFGGELPASRVQQDIETNLKGCGWPADRIAVIVIEPELEAWIWQNSPHVESAFKHKDKTQSLRDFLSAQRRWPAEAAKPPEPKATAEFLLKRNRAGTATAIYAKIAEKISVKGCVDPAFRRMRLALRTWFPADGEHA